MMKLLQLGYREKYRTSHMIPVSTRLSRMHVASGKKMRKFSRSITMSPGSLPSQGRDGKKNVAKTDDCDQQADANNEPTYIQHDSSPPGTILRTRTTDDR